MRQLHKVVTCGDKEVVVRELSVAELRQWIADATKGEFDFLNEKLKADTPLTLLALMAGMTVDALLEVAPYPETDLEPIRKAAKECNPSFFGALKSVAAAGRPT